MKPLSRRRKKNVNPALEAKNEQWIVANHLYKYYGKYPESLENLSADDLFEEEKLVLFYIEAQWGSKSREIQLAAILTQNLEEIIAKPAKSFTPEAVQKNIDKFKANAPSQKAADEIEYSMADAANRNKMLEVGKVLDALKEMMLDVDWAKLKIKTGEKLRLQGVKGSL